MIKSCVDPQAALSTLRGRGKEGKFSPALLEPTGDSILIFKPDCYRLGLESLILDLYRSAGFTSEPLGEVRFTSAHTLSLWTDNFQALREWRANTKHLCSRPGEAFSLTGPGGVKKVLEIKHELRRILCDPSDVFVRLIHSPDSALELERNLHFLRNQYPLTQSTAAMDPEHLWFTLVRKDPIAAELARLNLPVDVHGGWTLGAHQAGKPVDLVCHVPERMMRWLPTRELLSQRVLECEVGSCNLTVVPFGEIADDWNPNDQERLFRYRTLRYFGEGAQEVRQSVGQLLERWKKSLSFVVEAGFRKLGDRARALSAADQQSSERDQARELYKHTAIQLFHNLYDEPCPSRNLMLWSLQNRFPQTSAGFIAALQQIDESNAAPEEIKVLQRMLTQIAGMRGYIAPTPPWGMYAG